MRMKDDDQRKYTSTDPAGTGKTARNEPDANRDPITDAPGAHPVGVGIGTAAGGAAAGAAGGAVAGPVGAVVGAVVGGIAGAAAGKGVAEKINPTVEHDYWRKSYSSRKYVPKGSSYDDYGPAYEYGWTAYSSAQYSGKPWEHVESDLGSNWPSRRGSSSLDWDRARDATRDAWHRASHEYGPKGGSCTMCGCDAP